MLSDTTLKNAAGNCDTIQIDMEYDAATHKLAANQTIAYKNRTGGNLNEIWFHTYANAYKDGAKNPPVTNDEIPKAYPNGKNFGGIAINSVVVGKNNSVIPIVRGDDDTVLVVPIPNLAPNKVIKITMNYVVQLANIKHRLGWTDDAVNLANFYPVPCVFENNDWADYPYSSNGDPFYNDVHNFLVKVTTPRNMTIASSGTAQKSKETDDGKKTVTLKSSAIRDFAMVVSRKFKNISKRTKTTLVNYYYLNDDKPDASLDISVKAVETFSNLFVKYPYKQLTVVQTDFLHGGMEYGELVYVSRDLLPEDRENHNYVIVHEIAHQWWYGMVGNNQSATAWIDEGLAEYSSMLFFDNNPEYNFKRETIIDNARKNYSTYVKLVRGVGAELDTTMNRELSDFNTPYEYVYMTYVRGFLLFCDLEKILSKDNLVAALNNFSRDVQFKIATQESLEKSIQNKTGASVNMFFESYLNGWDGYMK
jgi:hypothetical protein